MILRDITLTKEDLDRSQWEQVLAQSAVKECRAYQAAFYAKAKEAESAGDVKNHQVFVLLEALTFLMLKLDSEGEPFAATQLAPGLRGAGLDDFSDDQFKLLMEVAPSVSDPEMRARMADVVWAAKRDVKMAELAVDSYLQSAAVLEHPEHWSECTDRIERAIHVAASLGNNREPFDRVIAQIEYTLDKYGGEDPLFLSARLMELLQKFRPGDPKKYAPMASKAASRAEQQHAWHIARAYLEIEACWHRIAKDSAGERDALLRLSETYVSEANDKLRDDRLGYSLAAHCLGRAIETLRKLAGTKDRRDELQRTMLDYQAKSMSHMGTVSQTVDLTVSATRAREMVKGKSFSDALFYLAMSFSSPKVGDLREQVKHLAQIAPFHYLLPSETLDPRGRIVGRKPGTLSDDPNDAEAAIRVEMFRNSMLSQSFYTYGVIEPARAQINLEHAVRIADFLPVVSNNPLAPPGREVLYARGLYAGMTGDFLVAVHLLIPQFENSVRFLLDRTGVPTSGMDAAGIQEDFDLNKMLYMPELTRVFDENTIFDLRGLLIERLGSNLRNRMAHGLAEEGDFYSTQAAYLWWLILHLCCIPILDARAGEHASEEE